MSPLPKDRWDAISPYLDQALELSGEERTRWLAALSVENPTVAAELEELLAEQAAISRDGFLAHDAPLPVDASLVGQTIGAYTLVSPIGHGGMGSVWLARRSDGRFEGLVAIKLLNTALVGRGGEQRFRREGTILARLAHPAIAHLVDAGVSSLGQPYLVLERVEGEHIDEYCDKRNLDIDARIHLFLNVLAGVSHAHANLIVHRDIKPSNVLVTADGQVKLLDFGIAKLLEHESPTGVATMLTLEGGAALTPAYAAPEQVTGEPVSTGTDIYALGLLLYVLLTGRHPAGDHLRSQADLIKAIVDTEPPLASDVVVTTTSYAESAAMHAARRASMPEKLRRQLRGDLDTILQKALKKNPEERYVSVTALANDLSHYLNHQPISARPETVAYRTAKFVRRNRLSVAVAVLMLVGLSVSLYVVNMERTIALRRFTQVRQLANKILALDTEIRGLVGSTKARHEIVAMSQEYLEALRPEARADPELALEIATAYSRLALAQGVPLAPNLGQYAQAEESLRKADALLEAVLADFPENRLALMESAQVAHARMTLADSDKRREEALIQARKSAGHLDALLGLGKPSQAEVTRAVWTFVNIALAHKNSRLFEDAVRYARRAIDVDSLWPSADSDQYRANAWSLVADSMRLSGDPEGALEAIREAHNTLDAAHFSNENRRRSTLFNVLWREGVILGEADQINVGRPHEAIAVLQRAFDLIEEWAQKDPDDAQSRILFASAGRELGSILRQNEPQRALAIYDQALLRLGQVKNNTKARRDEVVLLAGSSYPLQRLGRSIEARSRLDAAFGRLNQLRLYPVDQIELGSEADNALRALADYEAKTGNVVHAIEICRSLLDQVLASKPKAENYLADAADLSRLFASLADLQRRAARPDLAAELDTRRLQLWEHWDQKLPNNPFVSRQLAAVRVNQAPR